MTAFVRPMLMSALSVGFLAHGGGAQPPAPPAPPTPPAPPSLPAVEIELNRNVLFGAPGRPGFAPGGHGGMFSATGAPFGDDPKARELARKLAAAKPEEREKLREQLREALVRSFEERLKGQEKQVEQLEAQIQRIKEMVAKRQENKGEIIADRLSQLEKEAKGLGW